MCGISGVFSKNGFLDERTKIMAQNMSRLVQHRGPDGTLQLSCESAQFCHSKLSIRDRTSASDQPIKFRQYVLLFNGEIYNCEELAEALGMRPKESRFDGEILGPAYEHFGDSLWKRLDGEFAIAVYDRDTNRLVLVRDRLGAKPLFYAELKNKLFFASEAKAIFHLLERSLLNADRLCSDLIFGTWAPRNVSYLKV